MKAILFFAILCITFFQAHAIPTARHLLSTCVDDTSWQDQYGETCSSYAPYCKVPITDCSNLPAKDEYNTACEPGGLQWQQWYVSPTDAQTARSKCPKSCEVCTPSSSSPTPAPPLGSEVCLASNLQSVLGQYFTPSCQQELGGAVLSGADIDPATFCKCYTDMPNDIPQSVEDEKLNCKLKLSDTNTVVQSFMSCPPRPLAATNGVCDQAKLTMSITGNLGVSCGLSFVNAADANTPVPQDTLCSCFTSPLHPVSRAYIDSLACKALPSESKTIAQRAAECSGIPQNANPSPSPSPSPPPPPAIAMCDANIVIGLSNAMTDAHTTPTGIPDICKTTFANSAQAGMPITDPLFCECMASVPKTMFETLECRINTIAKYTVPHQFSMCPNKNPTYGSGDAETQAIIQASTTYSTCNEIREVYQGNTCCGNPNKQVGNALTNVNVTRLIEKIDDLRRILNTPCSVFTQNGIAVCNSHEPRCTWDSMFTRCNTNATWQYFHGPGTF